jgi:hypothetical protein
VEPKEGDMEVDDEEKEEVVIFDDESSQDEFKIDPDL